MALDAQTKLYVKEIVEEAMENLPCKDNDDRVRKVEQKVFNGYGSNIKILYGLYTVVIGLLIQLAFF